jgi:hypothetical protein
MDVPKIYFIDDFHLLPPKSSIFKTLGTSNLIACGTIYPDELIHDADVRSSRKLFGNFGISKLMKHDSRFDKFDLIMQMSDFNLDECGTTDDDNLTRRILNNRAFRSEENVWDYQTISDYIRSCRMAQDSE